MGRADQGLPRPNSHLPPEEPLSVAAVYLQHQPLLQLMATRLRTLHAACTNTKGQRRALRIACSKALQLARLLRTMHAWLAGHRIRDCLFLCSTCKKHSFTLFCINMHYFHNPTPVRRARCGCRVCSDNQIGI